MRSLSKLNYINVGPGGRFKHSGNADNDTTPNDITAIFDYLNADQTRKHVLLYFHGGLVSEASGIATAVDVTPALAGAGVHPISFVWETGLIETVRDNLDTIWQTEFFKKILEKIIKVAGSKLGISTDFIGGTRGIASVSYNEIRAELQKEAPFDNYKVVSGDRSANVIGGRDRQLSDEIEFNIEQELLADPFFRQAPLSGLNDREIAMIHPEKLINQPAAGTRGVLSLGSLIKAAVIIIFKVIKRFVAKRDHGFYPTVIEEILREVYVDDIGTTLWGDMKTKAELMWKEDVAGTPELEQHAGSYFLKQLKDFAAGSQGVTIDLVGHSAGSIVICYFLEAFYNAQINATIRNTIFMAPACRSDLFYQKVIEPELSIGNFRMFTMSDAYECKDRCVPIIYTRSLLYMISGILEKNEFDAYILGMQRYLLSDEPYGSYAMLREIAAFMDGAANRTVFAVTEKSPLDGLRCIAEHHGGFAKADVLTIGSIAYILTH